MKTDNTTDVTAQTDQALKPCSKLSKGGKKQTLIARKDRIVIGTVESADVKLTGTKVSPVHAFLELRYAQAIAIARLKSSISLLRPA